MAAVPDSEEDFYVVGIGASAGGLDALRTLFSSMPAKPGYACVVVVHLSPEHESRLVELLQPHTQMPVLQVRQTVPVKPNHVYVIPPNANLNSIDTHLRLSQLEARRIERATIDHFLRTLAATHDGRAVGVILTGTGSDGALGIRLIKECGGLTIAQDPEEAEYESMPLSAIATGTVDLILPVRKVAEEIARFCETRPQLPLRSDDAPATSQDELRIDGIVDEVRRHTGHDFSMYRRTILVQRIRHRMQLRHLDGLQDYLERVRLDVDEARALCRDLQLHVTEFFEDPEFYDALEHKMLPDIFAAQPSRVRVWSIGCSTGEEAYSLAMLLTEQSEQFRVGVDVQIFASDVSDDALQRARQGLYPPEVAASVGSARLERFFVRDGTQFRIRKDVREHVIFATHNLFKDPPYSRLNLIVCRNLLHELQPEVRAALLNLFFYALADGGFLVVGHEDEMEVPQLFEPDESGAHVFRRRPGSRREATGSWLNLRSFTHPAPAGSGLFGIKAIDEQYRSAVERYAPPMVLIDGAGEVLRFSTGAHRYIRIPGGRLTNSLARMLPGAIRTRLEHGLAEVEKTGRAWASDEFVIDVNGVRRQLALRLDPLGSMHSGGRMLVIFDERLPAVAPERADLAICGLEETLSRANLRIGELLAGTPAEPQLRTMLQELRSMLEQLTASREQLRTINEELIALDAENRGRMADLAQTSDDLRNILESTGVATLVLDEQLRVTRVTEPAAKLFRLTPQDVGRRLREIMRMFGYPDIEQEAERALAHETRVDREVSGDDGRWYLSRMLPYRSAGHGVEGVVISFIDISHRKRAEAALRESEEQQRLIVQLVPALLWWTDPAGRDVSVNFQWKTYTGQSEGEVQNFGWLQAMHPDDREATRTAFRHAYLTGQAVEREIRIRRTDGEYRWHLVRHVPVRDDSGAVARWFGAALEIHESRELQDRQQTLLAELHHRTRNLITVVQAICQRTIDKSTSLDDFRDKFNRRLSALSRVQSLLSHLSLGERVTFDQLLSSELAALDAPEDRVTLAGPSGVPLRSGMIQVLAMAIHELTTNAVKYGAFSPAGGHLHVRWHVEPASAGHESILHVDWRESGVTMADPHAPRRGGGYGRELIENALPYQLKAKTTYTLGPDGVHWTIAVSVPAAKTSQRVPAP
jgi:two-component system, chemotaxis family, CheB/CheR fusion protein